MKEAFEAKIEHLSQQLQGAQAHALHETKLRQEAKVGIPKPRVFDEELHGLRLAIQGLRKYEEKSKYWKAKVIEKAGYLKIEEEFSLYAQVTVGEWFVKCEEVDKLANYLIHVIPKRIKRFYDDVTYENTPHAIFNFILFCQDMVHVLREELEHLKKVRGVAK